jgi:hypothetical protein
MFNIINPEYLIDSFLYNTHSYFGFKKQGIQIRKNAYLFKNGWDTHLENCKEIIRKSFPLFNKGSVSVLGSGSLLDFPLEILNNKNFFYFQDADISSLNSKNKKIIDSLSINSHFCLLDISSYIKNWADILINYKNINFNEALEIIEVFGEEKKSITSFIKGSTCISLNILSQLPVYWQDFVFSYLKARFGKNLLVKNEKLILEKLSKSSNLLIKTHLEKILPTKKNYTTLLISDIKYLYLPKNIKPYIEKNNSLFEVKFKEVKANKKNEKTIKIEEQDALFSLDLFKWNKNLVNNFKIEYLDSWLWNIGQNSKHSIYHQVVAVKYSFSSPDGRD